MATVRCPFCKTTYNLAESTRGKKVLCTACNQAFRVPQAAQPQQQPAASMDSGKPVFQESARPEPAFQGSERPEAGQRGDRKVLLLFCGLVSGVMVSTCVMLGGAWLLREKGQPEGGQVAQTTAGINNASIPEDRPQAQQPTPAPQGEQNTSHATENVPQAQQAATAPGGEQSNSRTAGAQVAQTTAGINNASIPEDRPQARQPAPARPGEQNTSRATENVPQAQQAAAARSEQSSGRMAANVPNAQPPAASARDIDAGGSARGPLSATVLKRLKEATVFIKVDAGQLSCTGSGFLFRAENGNGYIITNHHVVNPEAELLIPGRTSRAPPRIVQIKAKRPQISTVFRSGTRDEQAVSAEIVATDPSRDLAVLKFGGAKDLATPIELSQADQLVETMPIYILGFPFGKALALNKGNPAITVNKGSISSLRANDYGQMKAVQIDGAINPGNSGGPVVDEQGRLVGIAVATIPGANIGIAIAPDELTRMFEGRIGALGITEKRINETTIEITIEADLIDPLNKMKSVAIQYSLDSGPIAKSGPSADGKFNSRAGTKMDLRIDHQKATGSFRIALSAGSNRWLNVQPMYMNGAGTIVYMQPSPRQLNRQSSAVAQSTPRTTGPGSPALPNGPASGRTPRNMGPNNPGMSNGPPPTTIAAKLELPALPDPLEITPAPVKSETAYELPDTVGSLCVGGGGRFLIIHFPKIRKLGIFDASKAKIERFIAMAEDDVHFAAGMTKLLVYLSGSKVIQRYDLLTGERDKSGRLEVPDGKIEAFCMGHASAGPLLVSVAASVAQGSARLYDADQFKEIGMLVDERELSRDGSARAQRLEGGKYWAGASGRVFGQSGTYGQPNGVRSVIFEERRIQQFHEHVGSSFVIPGPDDKHIYAGGHGVLTKRLEVVPNAAYSYRDSTVYCSNVYLPAHHGPYYLHAQINRPLPGEETPVGTVRLFILGDKTPLASYANTVVCKEQNWTDLAGLGIGHTLHLIPKAKLLVIIPSTRKELRLYPADLEAALDRTDRNYILFFSSSPESFQNGKTLTYAAEVKAKKGPVTFKLETAPKGMTVDSQGKVEWAVPVDFTEDRVNVLLSAKDATGQEAFQSFNLVRSIIITN